MLIIKQNRNNNVINSDRSTCVTHAQRKGFRTEQRVRANVEDTKMFVVINMKIGNANIMTHTDSCHS